MQQRQSINAALVLKLTQMLEMCRHWPRNRFGRTLRLCVKDIVKRTKAGRTDGC